MLRIGCPNGFDSLADSLQVGGSADESRVMDAEMGLTRSRIRCMWAMLALKYKSA